MAGCDNRYWRDRRDGLAIRLIGHEVRNSTIRSWTGLTDRQIRQLCWNVRSTATEPPRRRRGRPPRQADFFTRNLYVQLESAQLCCALVSFGLLEHADHGPLGVRSIEYLILFCEAYETHCQLFLYSSRISLERAWFLLELLIRGNEFEIVHCRHCQGRYLCDGRNAGRRACPCCSLKAIG